MAGISSKALNGVGKNKFKYNSYENNTDFDLNIYESFYRTHDPQLGRFWQIDPKIEVTESWSPYSAMLNNPILLNDPLGDVVRNAHDNEVVLATLKRNEARDNFNTSMESYGVNENVRKKQFLQAGHSEAEWKDFKSAREAFNSAEKRLNTALRNQFEAQEDINQLAHNNPTLFNNLNSLSVDVFVGRTNHPEVRVEAGGAANVYGLKGENVYGRMYNLDDLVGSLEYRPGIAIWFQIGINQYNTVKHEAGHTLSMYGGVPSIGIIGIPYGTPGNPSNLNDYIRKYALAWSFGCKDCRNGQQCNPSSAAAVATERLPIEAKQKYKRAKNPF